MRVIWTILLFSVTQVAVAGVSLTKDGSDGASLQVNGTERLNIAMDGFATLTEALVVGDSASTCDATVEGGLRYNTTSNKLELCNGTAWTESVFGAPFAGVESFKIVASDGAANDYFGARVHIDGNYVVAGASGDDDMGSAAGAAYVFNASTGAQLHKLLASDGEASDYLGGAVAVSGNYAIIGAYGDDDNGWGAGAAYIFDVTTGLEQRKLLASDGAASDAFARDLDIDGNYAIVGAPLDDDNGSGSGSAYIFDVTTGAQLHKLLPSDGAAGDNFGYSVEIDGNYAVVGADLNDDNGTSSGSAYIFDVTTGAQLHKLLPSDNASGDQFGRMVAIRGTKVMVGAYLDDDNGDASGAAYIFDVSTGAELYKLLASDGETTDRFGAYVSMNDTLGVVGAYYEDEGGTDAGAAYVFDLNTGTQLFKLLASDAFGGDWFGLSLGMGDTKAIISAYGDANKRGAAYIFK